MPPPASYRPAGAQTYLKPDFSAFYSHFQVTCQITSLPSDFRSCEVSSPHLQCSKESRFSEILISAVKSTFSHSNHHKSIKELFWKGFLKICFSPYVTHREAIEVPKQFLGKLSKFQQNEQHLRICMELRFQIWSTH